MATRYFEASRIPRNYFVYRLAFTSWLVYRDMCFTIHKSFCGTQNIHKLFFGLYVGARNLNVVKEWKSFKEQLVLLQGRGMLVDNEYAALDYLERSCEAVTLKEFVFQHQNKISRDIKELYSFSDPI